MTTARAFEPSQAVAATRFSVGHRFDARREGNLIGTDTSGAVDLGNIGSGVFLAGDDFGDAIGNRVGGTVPAARNLILGNNGNWAKPLVQPAT